jgi:hypothetical protein
MRVLWLGINDDPGCVLHFHELRCELRDAHGVTLAGPGYSWPYGESRCLSDLAGNEGFDWIVLDDTNALGYVRVNWDFRPAAKVAWREGDWHNGYRKETAVAIRPDAILSCVDRPSSPQDEFRDHPGRTLVPMAVNTKRFHPRCGPRRYAVGLFGKVGKAYASRTAARCALSPRGDAWLPTHGGYWRDGRGSAPGATFYNDELADALRDCAMVWVDGSDYGVFLNKYNEAAACGCLLVGEVPYNWSAYYPEASMVRCCPEEVNEVVDFYADHDRAREEIAERATEHCLENHSIEARAKQVMEVLSAS